MGTVYIYCKYVLSNRAWSQNKADFEFYIQFSFPPFTCKVKFELFIALIHLILFRTFTFSFLFTKLEHNADYDLEIVPAIIAIAASLSLCLPKSSAEMFPAGGLGLTGLELENCPVTWSSARGQNLPE